MSVYQVEEYYVYLKFKVETSKDEQEEILACLEDLNFHDFELNELGLTVDEFSDEYEAEEFESNFKGEFAQLF